MSKDKVIHGRIITSNCQQYVTQTSDASANLSVNKNCFCHLCCRRITTKTTTTTTSSAALVQLVKVLLLITLCSSLVLGGMTKRARKTYGKHLIIHVPMKIRTHHHMHTVYKHVQGSQGVGGGGGEGDNSKGATKQTIYKIMGYSTHHTSAGGGGGRGSGYGHSYGSTYKQGHRHSGGGIGGEGYGEINYDDYPTDNCDDSMAHGDMIFNHYSRHDEEFPEVEELIEDEREGDEWVKYR
ncbi:uncharacterized protein LOC142236545 [Haematobia irritans]|uniref:uncharacterized protein LOC142236545 n=1 Tax=Haematobia irritans TaxID=7368 RepID=UPI003F50710A